MEELSILTNASLDKYFKVLARTGNRNITDVYSLIALSTINHILFRYNEYITEEDLRSITNALTCISGTCLIDYLSSTTNEDSLFRDIQRRLNTRVSQKSVIRHTEDGIFRIEA